jgi:hypothetical protein
MKNLHRELQRSHRENQKNQIVTQINPLLRGDGGKNQAGNKKQETKNSKREMVNMTRNELLKRLGRYILLMLIAIIAISLGKKISGANDCSTCAGKGVCNGKTDCNKY